MNAHGSRPAPVVPDYELLRCIGRGAYGEVWLARSALGTLRAVKVIFRDAFESDYPYAREFAGIREFEPVSAHESQVRVYHVGENKQHSYFYYVMDLADNAALSARARQAGEAMRAEVTAVPVAGSEGIDHEYVPATLSLRLLEEGRLPPADCLEIAVSLASALKHLHEHGLVHRDIKPANIVFVNGRPKLADIGLLTTTANANTFVGTAGYIPPEGPGQAQGDVYSFGKVLYEMCTGRDRSDFPELPEDFAALPERDALVELNEVILKACQNDPSARYASAAELLADLEWLYRGHSLRNRSRTKKQLIAAAVGAVVLLAAGSSALVWHSRASAVCLRAPEGLIAWWPGEDNGLDVVGGHDVAAVGGADFAPGWIGQAFQIKTTGQYFAAAHAPELSFTNGQPFTMEAWVYRKGGGIPFHVMGKREPAAGRCWYQMAVEYNMPFNAWMHLAHVHTGTSSLHYANGVLLESYAGDRCPGPNAAEFHIGSSYKYGGLDGLIDEVRIYNRALAAEEIKMIHHAGTNGMCLPKSFTRPPLQRQKN